MSEPLSEADLKAIREAIFAGRTITAIKVYRQCTGLGLKEAKDAIEEMEKKLRVESPEKFLVQQPERGEQQQAKSAKGVPGVQTGKGCFGVFLGVVLGIALTLVAVALWG
jgi:hypothetical protein